MEPEKRTSDEPQMIPLFVSESTAMHLGRANRRMLTALVCVCLTFIITIVIFVCGYTVREQNWLHTLQAMYQTPEAAPGTAAAPNGEPTTTPATTEEPPDGVYK